LIQRIGAKSEIYIKTCPLATISKVGTARGPEPSCACYAKAIIKQRVWTINKRLSETFSKYTDECVTQHLSGISQAAGEVIQTQNRRHVHLPNIYAAVDSA
jgi:hypothetical protein